MEALPRAPTIPPLRDRLILTFAPLVKYIVYRKVREMPARCEVEDFISCGLEALIQSIDRYDPSKGATLEQYAWTRIHGAVLDELRRQDWAPRSVRRWERDMEQGRRRVHHAARPPARRTEELAEAMGITVDELRKRRDEITQSDLTSLNTLVLGRRRDDDRAHRHASPRPTRALDPLARRRQGPRPRTSSAPPSRSLPQREREVAVMLYVKNLTLAEIGEVLGVSESRVCQIHGQLKKTLRAMLDDDADAVRSSSPERDRALRPRADRARSGTSAVGAEPRDQQPSRTSGEIVSVDRPRRKREQDDVLIIDPLRAGREDQLPRRRRSSSRSIDQSAARASASRGSRAAAAFGMPRHTARRSANARQ